jgi:hypothetical protein
VKISGVLNGDSDRHTQPLWWLFRDSVGNTPQELLITFTPTEDIVAKWTTFGAQTHGWYWCLNGFYNAGICGVTLIPGSRVLGNSQWWYLWHLICQYRLSGHRARVETMCMPT